jgi:CDP-diglyceride synthetase
MRTSRRLFVAATTPLLVAVLFGLGAWLYVDVLGQEVSERVAMIFGYLFAWPLLILKPIIPSSESQLPNAGFIRIGIHIIALLCVWITYSSLIYVILSWREGQRRKNV